MKLTALNIGKLPPGEYVDALLPGLQLTVGARRRSWSVRYRVGGKQCKPVIGYFVPNAPDGSDSMGLADAREKAREILSRVEAGVPTIEATPAHPKEGGLTLGELIDSYETMKRRKGGRGVKSLDEALRAVRKGLKAYLALPCRSFSKADLRAARDEVAKGGLQMSDRFMAYLGPVWKWATQEEIVEYNFVPDVLRIGPKLVRRERVLTPDEIRAIWNGCARMETEAGRSYGRLVRFLLISAQRREEGGTVRYGDFIDAHWKLKTKGGKPHKLRLPQLALDILGTGAADALAFPGRGGVQISGWSKYKRDLDKLCGIADWRLHDLRRTAASTLEDELGFPADTVHAVMNHEKKDLRKTYMVGALEKQKAEALKAWAAYLTKVVGPARAVL